MLHKRGIKLETLTIALLVILGAVIIMLATKVVAGTFKVVTTTLLLIIIVIAALSILVQSDLNRLKSDITQAKSVFILKDENDTYAAVAIKPGNTTTFDFESFIYYEDSDLPLLEEAIESGERPDNETGRIFIVTPNLINKTYKIDLGIELNENDLLELLESDQPYKVLSDKLSPEYSYTASNLEKAYGSEGKIKGYALAALILNYFHQEDLALSKNVKTGNLIIIPEPFSMKIIKYSPFLAPW